MNKLSKLLAGILIFVILFYNREPGINLSLFALSIWALSIIKNPEKTRGKMYWLLSISCWISILSFAWYGDVLSLFAVLFSIIFFVMYLQFPKLRLATYPLVGIINFFTFPFRIFFFNHWLKGLNRKPQWKKWIATAIIPVIFLILFLFVYSTGSDLFRKFFKNIFFEFDPIQIFILGLLGFFILFNLWFMWVPKLLIKLNNELGDEFSETGSKSFILSFSFFDKNLELRSGKITFILLNLLLLIFIITYNYEQFFSAGELGKLSDEIHQRIATVIGSIVLAIGMVLFYFKSKINFHSEGRLLKKLSLAWIILNSLLLVSAFIKNGEYILNYGLTFKRISVFIFLILCQIGLLLTWYKINRQKTNIFLINKMGWVFFFALVICSPVNFSWIVTKYNLNHPKYNDPTYLQSLDYNKKILYDTYKDNPEWINYFSEQKTKTDFERKRGFLSSRLYYRFLPDDL